jgi:1-acyl-sn-glycerol-3-phosphate acyltransferase
MIRQILVSTGIILDTIIMGLIYIFLSPLDFNGKFFDFMSRNWSKILLFISGVKVKIIGIENINKNQSYIVVSNHQSLFDIPVVIANLPLSVRMIAKKELFWIPVFGWAIYVAGHISIERGSGRKAKRSLEKALEKVRKKKFSIVVYPEGTRSPDGEVKEFGKGAFRLSFESKLPILPVAIKDTRKVLPRDSLGINKGEVKILIGKPIIMENVEKRELNTLKDRVRSEIIKSMENAI